MKFFIWSFVTVLAYLVDNVIGLKADIMNFSLKGSLNVGSNHFFKMGNMIDEQKKLKCGLTKLNFSFSPSTTYSDFIFNLKIQQLKLSNKEMKQVYSVLDQKNIGYFSRSRWDHFVEVFLNNFILCDENSNCGLSKDELVNCIGKINDFKVINDYVIEGDTLESLVNVIIKSYDTEESGEINLSSFINFKRMFVGFKNHNLNNHLDKELFMKAFKLSYNDYALDKQDLELIFSVGSDLVSKNSTSLTFNDYFEIGRITSSWLSYGIPISQGYLTRSDILSSPDGCSKANIDYYRRYFSNIVSDDKAEISNAFGVNIDSITIRFQDFFTIEYWASWYGFYSESDNMGSRKMNEKGFEGILKHKLKEKYKRYIAYSNFEDESKFKYSTSPINATDIDFLLGKSFLEFELTNTIVVPSLFDTSSFDWKKMEVPSNLYNDNDQELNFVQNKMKTHKSVFSFMKQEELKAQETETSKLAATNTSQADSSKQMLDDLFKKGIKNYYVMLDLYDDKFVYFEAFISFIKYLQVFDFLNLNNTDIRGVIRSDIIVLKPETTCHPQLSFQEQSKLVNLYSNNCNSIDFLYFVDYMISDLVFKPYINDSSKNFIEEIYLLLGLKKLNLYTPNHDYSTTLNSEKLSNLFDYNSAVSSALKQRCSHNSNIYIHQANPKFITQFDKPLNSTNSTTNAA